MSSAMTMHVYLIDQINNRIKYSFIKNVNKYNKSHRTNALKLQPEQLSVLTS